MSKNKKKNSNSNKDSKSKTSGKDVKRKSGINNVKLDATKPGAKQNTGKKDSKHAGAGKNRRAAKYRRAEDSFATDCAASIPGIMMILMLTTIFLIELLGRIDVMGQVSVYQFAFRVFDYVTIVVGIVFLIYEGTRGKLNFALREALGKVRASKAARSDKNAKTGKSIRTANAARETNTEQPDQDNRTASLSGGILSAFTVNAWIELFFGLFMICIIISTCINGLDSAAAFGLPARYIGIFNMFAFFLIYMKVSEYINKDMFRHVILVSLLGLGNLIAVSVLWNQYIGQIPAYQNKAGISAIFVNSNHYGYFVGLVIVVGIGYWVYEKQKLAIIGAASALLNLIALALNNTLGAQLAVGICVVGMTVMILIFDRDDKLILKKMLGTMGFFIVCVVGALAVFPEVRSSVTVLFTDMGTILAGNATGAEGSGRMQIWLQGVDYVSQHPLFGSGCEGITMEMKETLGLGDVHSEPLTYAIYYGIPALLFYLAGLAMVFIRYLKGRRGLPATCRIAFIGASAYFLSSLVGVAMFYTAPFFFIFMGLAASAGGRNVKALSLNDK